jgi:hypothetical protein
MRNLAIAFLSSFSVVVLAPTLASVYAAEPSPRIELSLGAGDGRPVDDVALQTMHDKHASDQSETKS